MKATGYLQGPFHACDACLLLQVMPDVPAELRTSLLLNQEQQGTRELAAAQMPLEQTLAEQSEASTAAAGQQRAAVIDLTDEAEPTAKRHRA